MFPAVRQINPIYNITLYSFKIQLKIISHIHLGLPISIPFSQFAQNCVCFLHPYNACSVHTRLFLLNLITLIIIIIYGRYRSF